MNNSNYKDLQVWHLSIDLVVEIYNLIMLFPKSEDHALSDQMRRCSVSIPSNIAEGHGKGSHKEFIHFLYHARGSLYELETQLTIAMRVGYISPKDAEQPFSMITQL